MAHEPAEKPAEKLKALTLPLSVARPADVGRLTRELENIEDSLLQSKVKSEEAAKLPRISRLMEQLIEANRLDLMRKEDREKLKAFLGGVKETSPIFHISFNADPAPAFVEKLMAWFRQEVHPTLLVNIGLQPNIGAGCILRTVNKQFDMSLRQDFAGKRGLLRERLSAKAGKPPAPVPVQAPAAPKETA